MWVIALFTTERRYLTQAIEVGIKRWKFLILPRINLVNTLLLHLLIFSRLITETDRATLQWKANNKAEEYTAYCLQDALYV